MELREQNIIDGGINKSLDESKDYTDFDNLSQEEIREMMKNDPNLYLKYLEYIDIQVEEESKKHYRLDEEISKEENNSGIIPADNLETKEVKKDLPRYAWQDRKDLE